MRYGGAGRRDGTGAATMAGAGIRTSAAALAVGALAAAVAAAVAVAVVAVAAAAAATAAAVPATPAAPAAPAAPAELPVAPCVLCADHGAQELKGLVEMLVPNPLPTLVAEMIAELDINRDGEVDLWEFCVHMQKRAEGITLTDLEQEVCRRSPETRMRPNATECGRMRPNATECDRNVLSPHRVQVDMAFKLFSADAAGHASEEELRRVMTNAGTGVGLSAGEFEDLLNDLSNRGIRRADGAIDLRALRAHPCYENESAGVEGSSNE